MSSDEPKPLPDLHRIAVALRSPAFSVTELADRTGILLDTNRLVALHLNPSALVVVKSLTAAPGGPNGLGGALSAVFTIDQETAEIDVSTFLDDLSQFLST